MPNYDRTKLFTHSNVTIAEECLLRFKLEYIDGLTNESEDRVSPYARRGSAFHKAASDYLENIRAIKPDDPKAFWEAAKKDEINNSPAEDEAPLRDLFKTFEQKHGNPPEVMPIGAAFIGAEVSFMLDAKGALTANFDEARVAGTIDLVYADGDTLVIVDWKTGFSMDLNTPIELNPQMRLYGYAAALMFPDKPLIRPILDYVHLDATYPANPVDFAREDFTETAWPWFAARTARVGGAIASGKFPARPNENCGFCPVRDKCPSYQNALVNLPEDGKLDRPAQVLKLLRLVEQAESRIKEYRGAIRKYIEDHGPLVDEETHKAYKFIPNPAYEADTETVVKALLSLGLEKDGKKLDGAEIRSRLSISKTMATELVKDFTEPRSPLRKDATMKVEGLYSKVERSPKLSWIKEA